MSKDLHKTLAQSLYGRLGFDRSLNGYRLKGVFMSLVIRLK